MALNVFTWVHISKYVFLENDKSKIAKQTEKCTSNVMSLPVVYIGVCILSIIGREMQHIAACCYEF